MASLCSTANHGYLEEENKVLSHRQKILNLLYSSNNQMNLLDIIIIIIIIKATLHTAAMAVVCNSPLVASSVVNLC